MSNRKKFLLAGFLIAATSQVFASDVAEEIRKTNEEVARLSAKLAEMDVKAKIAAKEQEISRLNAPVGAGGSGGNFVTEKALPVIRSIEGAGDRLTATLATSGGITQTVSKGDHIDGWTVIKIDVNSVTLGRGTKGKKNAVRLSFGSEPPAVASNGSVQGAPVPNFSGTPQGR